MSQANSVMITGSSSGFGRLMARTLVEKEYTVFATMRDPSGRNSSVANELQEYGKNAAGDLHILDLDVTSDSSVDSAVAEAQKIAGGPDIVVNNAGIGVGGFAEAFTVDQYQRIFDINVFGVQRVNRAVLPTMRKKGAGLLIHVSSIMGRVVIPFAAPYTATKYAMEGMVESYRYELAGTGVEVSIIEPGGFHTGIANRMMAPADTDRVTSYGSLSEAPDKLWGGMMKTLQESGPDPQAVADAALEIISAPVGKRPLRVVVDPLMGGEGAKTINATTDQIQAALLDAFGMGGAAAAQA